jgi:hypothetical protein
VAVWRAVLLTGPAYAAPAEAKGSLDYPGRTRPQAGDGAYRQALARLCKLVLNLNEFVYVD